MSWYAMSTEQSQLYDDGKLEIDDVFFANAAPVLTDDKYKVEQKVCLNSAIPYALKIFISTNFCHFR